MSEMTLAKVHHGIFTYWATFAWLASRTWASIEVSYWRDQSLFVPWMPIPTVSIKFMRHS